MWNTENSIIFTFFEDESYDADLLTREGVFIFKKLVEIDSEIRNEMLVALRRRISKLCNKDIVSLKSHISRVSCSNFDSEDSKRV
jgi:hypothetical protein